MSSIHMGHIVRHFCIGLRLYRTTEEVVSSQQPLCFTPPSVRRVAAAGLMRSESSAQRAAMRINPMGTLLLAMSEGGEDWMNVERRSK